MRMVEGDANQYDKCWAATAQLTVDERVKAHTACIEKRGNPRALQELDPRTEQAMMVVFGCMNPEHFV